MASNNIEVIAVQSTQAPSMKLSWDSGTMVEAEMRTLVEGLATRVLFENTQRIVHEVANDFLLVDDDINAAVAILLEHTHNLVEEAAAAPLAAALQQRGQFKNKQVVPVVTGGNIAMQNLKKVVERIT